MELRALDRAVAASDLPAILAGKADPPPSSGTGIAATIETVLEAEKGHWQNHRKEGLEFAVAWPLYQALNRVPRRRLLEPGLWNWLAIDPLREFVVHRWHDGDAPALGTPVSPQSMLRWSHTPTLHGVANHAIARLYWSAHLLGDPELLEAALGRQDLFKQLFERELSLHPPAARVCVRHYRGRGEDEWRSGIKALNLVLSTVAVEHLEEQQVVELLQQIER